MPADSALQLQASTTSTATAHSTGKNLPTGTALRGVWVRFIYSAADNASGSNTVVFSVSESADNATWNQKVVDNTDALTLSTTAQSGEVFLLVETKQPYIRADVTISGSGTSPTITWQADIVSAPTVRA